MTMTLNEILDSHRTRRPVVMGILNVTPDSFSDGGRFMAPADAASQAEQMAAQGADIIDIGAESTRPGSARVTPREQIRRIQGVISAAATQALVSIDTTSAEVAEFALDAGASIINDVSAGRDDPEILALAARTEAPLVLMHMLGEPKTMQAEPHYDDVVGDVRDFLSRRISAAVEAGVSPSRCIVDPGIGFGKMLEHNLALLAGVGSLCELGCPVLVGPSRKRFLGELTGIEAADERASATVAACLEAYRRGATIFRVHDVGPLKAALAVVQAVNNLATGDG